MSIYQSLHLSHSNYVQSVWLNLPDIRNAFNPAMIADLTLCFASVNAAETRVVVLGGRGKAFCAGADLNWMQEMAGYTQEQNNADALALANMLETIDSCPVPLIGRVHRAAFGGAIGLIACCDSVICTSDTRFAFSEVRLGISPATISPYVIAKIGSSGARDLFLSGEQFDAERALRMGLVHQVVEPEDLDSAVELKAAELLKAGPRAAIETKALIKSITRIADDELRRMTAGLIARLRVCAEGQEGLSAFLENRSPEWTNPS